MNDSLKNIINDLRDLRGVSLDSSRNTLVFPLSSNEKLISKLKEFNIEAENTGVDSAEIDINVLPLSIYFNEDDFLKRITRNSWTKPVFILNGNIFFSIEEKKTYIDFKESSNYYLISNNFYCYDFLSFLKGQDHKEAAGFYFVDYFNWDSRHVVLTSLKRDGKIEFILPNEGLGLKEDINLKHAVSEFKAAFSEQNKHFPKFIKVELINAISKIEKKDRLEVLLAKLNEIVYVASQNFEIYLQDLSLENLKKDFIEHKNKYFIQLREILSKMTNQIIGLPITIAASVFSTYKVSDSKATLLIILSVFVLYIFYSVYLLKIQKEDILDIKVSFQYDFDRLKDSLFFKKFNLELVDFNMAKSKLDSRIKSLISAIDLYFLFFAISSVLFLVYMQMQLNVHRLGIVVVSIISSLCLIVIYIYTQTLRRD